jgi:hypothetical protein
MIVGEEVGIRDGEVGLAVGLTDGPQRVVVILVIRRVPAPQHPSTVYTPILTNPPSVLIVRVDETDFDEYVGAMLLLTLLL